MRITILNNVYPPAEDSWQTAEVLEWVVDHYVKPHGGVVRIIDVGSGTGVVGLTAAKRLVEMGIGVWLIAIDHDYNAAINTKVNAVDNGLYDHVDVVSMNVLDAVRAGVGVDIVVSNPPYLPGDWREDWRVFGGPDGNYITEQIVGWVCADKPDVVVLTTSSFSSWDRAVEHLRMCGYRLVILKASHYFFEDVITMVFMWRSAQWIG